jgi:hypothetical protein
MGHRFVYVRLPTSVLLLPTLYIILECAAGASSACFML